MRHPYGAYIDVNAKTLILNSRAARRREKFPSLEGCPGLPRLAGMGCVRLAAGRSPLHANPR